MTTTDNNNEQFKKFVHNYLFPPEDRMDFEIRKAMLIKGLMDKIDYVKEIPFNEEKSK
jgi:hypothetical protein